MNSLETNPARKKRVTISQIDFSPLAGKLQEWIEIELEKIKEEQQND